MNSSTWKLHNPPPVAHMDVYKHMYGKLIVYSYMDSQVGTVGSHTCHRWPCRYCVCVHMFIVCPMSNINQKILKGILVIGCMQTLLEINKLAVLL